MRKKLETEKMQEVINSNKPKPIDLSRKLTGSALLVAWSTPIERKDILNGKEKRELTKEVLIEWVKEIRSRFPNIKIAWVLM